MLKFKEKFESKISSKFIFIIFCILVLIPKLNFNNWANHHAGIRIEDIIILIFAVFFLFNLEKFNITRKSIAFKFTFFFPFFLFAIFNGYLHNVYQYFPIIPRYIEYIVLLLIIDNFLKNPRYIVLIAQFVIILNCIAAFLQELNILGGISSVRYYHPGDLFLNRPFGISGGAWEIGVMVSISFFILLISNKQNILSLLLFFLMTVYCLIVAETRGNIIAFFIALIFINPKNIFKNIIFVAPLIIITIFILKDTSVLKNILNIDLIFLIDQFKHYIQFKTVDPTIYEYGQIYYSIGLRLEHLLPKYKIFIDNNYIALFGMGFNSVYYDSLIFRIIFSFGIFGTIIILFLARNINFGILIFIIIAGLTLDLFISFKIFLIFSLLFIYMDILKKEDSIS